jgi:hypothetical protein
MGNNDANESSQVNLSNILHHPFTHLQLYFILKILTNYTISFLRGNRGWEFIGDKADRAHISKHLN